MKNNHKAKAEAVLTKIFEEKGIISNSIEIANTAKLEWVLNSTKEHLLLMGGSWEDTEAQYNRIYDGEQNLFKIRR